MISLRRAAERGALPVLLAVAHAAAAPPVGARRPDTPPPSAASDVGALLAAAEERLAAGEAAAAEAEFRQLVVVAPRLAEARHGLARALAAQGERAEALRLLLELAAGSHGEPAIAYAEEAVAIAPEATAAQLALGRALMFGQRFTSALAPLAVASGAQDAPASAPLLYGLALWECGRLDQARRELERAVDRSHRGGVALHQLGRLHLWMGYPERALPLLLEAASAAPGAADLQLDLARALEQSGRLVEAIAAFRRAVQLAPELEAARYGLGRLLLRLGENEAGRAELAAFERLRAASDVAVAEQGLERARLDYGWSLIVAGRYAEAAAHFAAMAPDAEALAGLAQAHAALGDHAAARAALERAVGLAPERHDLRLLLAEARRREAEEREP